MDSATTLRYAQNDEEGEDVGHISSHLLRHSRESGNPRTFDFIQYAVKANFTPNVLGFPLSRE
jgi:hypothetical protein